MGITRRVPGQTRRARGCLRDLTGSVLRMERDPDQHSDDSLVDEEEAAAAAEAAGIGGVAGDEDLEPAERPVREAGGGEAEGFEMAEEDLIEHASHGDQHSARMALYHAGQDEEDGVTGVTGEADSATLEEEDRGDAE
jgi:hypothetical protein